MPEEKKGNELPLITNVEDATEDALEECTNHRGDENDK